MDGDIVILEETAPIMEFAVTFSSKGTSGPKPCQQNAPHSIRKPLDHHWRTANTFASQVVRYHHFVMGSSHLMQTQKVPFSVYVQHTPT